MGRDPSFMGRDPSYVVPRETYLAMFPGLIDGYSFIRGSRHDGPQLSGRLSAAITRSATNICRSTSQNVSSNIIIASMTIFWEPRLQDAEKSPLRLGALDFFVANCM